MALICFFIIKGIIKDVKYRNIERSPERDPVMGIQIFSYEGNLNKTH